MATPRLRVDLTLNSTNRHLPGPTRQRTKGEPSVRYCETGKQCYATKDAAWEAAENMMDAGRVEPGCHQTPVLCTVCYRWHVYNRRIHFASEVAS